MTAFEVPSRSRRFTGWIWAGFMVFAIAVGCSWFAHKEFNAHFDRLDEKAIVQSRQVLQLLLEEERKHRTSTVSLLAEDARLRAMVLTPDFDQATAIDLLTDIKSTARASVVAVLDSSGTVRSVIGAAELNQVNLGTSSLFKAALEQSTSQVWVFGNKAGVLAAAPVALGRQVRAVFLMGFAIESELLAKIDDTLGTSSAIFVGGGQVAASRAQPNLTEALASAAELAGKQYRVLENKYLAGSSQLGDLGSAPRVAWLAPLHRHSRPLALVRGLTALSAVFAGLMLAIVMGLAWGRSRAEPHLD